MSNSALLADNEEVPLLQVYFMISTKEYALL